MAVNIGRYQQRAAALHTAYQQTVQAVQADPAWSNQGRADAAQQARATYTKAMAQLQDEARAEVDAAKAANTAARRQAQAREVDRRRGVLGDAVFADVTRRRVEGLRSDALVQAVQDSPSDFERELLRCYGALAIAQRMAGEAPSAADRQAADWFAQQAAAVTAPFDQAAQELDNPAWVRKLDVLGDNDARAAYAQTVRGF